MPNTNLTNQQISFLQTLNFDPNSSNLKLEIQTLLKNQKANSQENPDKTQTKETIFLIIHGGSEREDLSQINIKSQAKQEISNQNDQNWRENYFYQNLKTELESQKIQVLYPIFSNSLNAEFEIWQKELKAGIQEVLGKTEKNTNFVVIAHSFGAAFVAKFLGQNTDSQSSNFSQQIQKLFLIAPSIGKNNFEITQNDEQLIAKMQIETEIWISTNDQIVPNEESLEYQKYFPKTKIKKLENRGHFEVLKIAELEILGKMPNSQENLNSNLTQILNKIYTKIIPQLQKSGQVWDIDYNFERSENKRWESLKKRGCSEIIKVE